MIIVTGAARSGTSLTTAVLEVCGAKLGKTNGNKENVAVRDEVLKPYLVSLEADPMGQSPLPLRNSYLPDSMFRIRVEHRLDGANCYKDAKIILCSRIWQESFPNAKWVLVRRDIDDIARSCVNTQFMKRLRTHEEWKNWAYDHQKRMDKLEEELKGQVISVWPHNAIHYNIDEFRRMIDFCNLTWDADAVRNIINPNKWHA
jgi:hypothetical protein